MKISEKQIKDHSCYQCMFLIDSDNFPLHCGVNGVRIRFPDAALSPYYAPEWCPFKQGLFKSKTSS